ncbi:unnamed protein product [Notodromas monacha]|uniref:Serpin domain-containing protein n=1 Tax=Notodromas monacha TaxID=399045 RepID=A0A7R9GHT4_9CRUS|nr:unnamed protein product [Notodromas monacha]CAG0921675.1 unnamed protein product [Notodromas monacha]
MLGGKMLHLSQLVWVGSLLTAVGATPVADGTTPVPGVDDTEKQHQAINEEMSEVQKLSRAHFDFTLELYSLLVGDSGDSRGNLLLSPYSLTSVLSMLYLGAGARSNTSLQLRNGLSYHNLSYSEVHRGFRQVVKNFEEPYYEGVVEAANAMFQQQGIPVSSYYSKALEEFYHSELDELDFAHNEPAARERINKWARKKTRGKIRHLIARPLGLETKLILANALYFRGKWLYPFNRALTFDKGLFYVTQQESCWLHSFQSCVVIRYEIPMMIGKLKVPMGSSPTMECQVLELPFKDRRISMFIFLPDDVDKGLSKLEASLTSETIKKLFSTLKDETVNVRLPRFKIEESTELKAALEGLGILDVFDSSKADFTGMSSANGVHVSDIFHKAAFEVNEEGAEGGAASAMGLERIGSFGEKYFEVDHPFIFIIWDYYSGMVLFFGRVVKPAAVTSTTV